MPEPETRQQRRQRYLRNAEKARESAARSSDPEISARYIALAETWERLAKDIA
jgi:hypothetical protein